MLGAAAQIPLQDDAAGEGDIYGNAPTYTTLKGIPGGKGQQKLMMRSEQQPVSCCCGIFSRQRGKGQKKQKKGAMVERPSDVSLVSGIFSQPPSMDYTNEQPSMEQIMKEPWVRVFDDLLP